MNVSLPLAPNPVKQRNIADMMCLLEIEPETSRFYKANDRMTDNSMRVAVSRFSTLNKRVFSCRKITVGIVQADSRFAEFLGYLQVYRHKDGTITEQQHNNRKAPKQQTEQQLRWPPLSWEADYLRTTFMPALPTEQLIEIPPEAYDQVAPYEVCLRYNDIVEEELAKRNA